MIISEPGWIRTSPSGQQEDVSAGVCHKGILGARVKLGGSQIGKSVRGCGKVSTADWRKEYNQVRPHSAKGYKPPAPEAKLLVTLTL
jgi:hypothetical protein